MATIVVGIEDSPRGQDAAALASDLARVCAADVLAVCAFPYDPRPSAHYNPAMEPRLREQAQLGLDRLADPIRSVASVRTRVVPDPAPARALLQAAAGADLLVVGSSHAGFSGHVLPGGTGARVLLGAPCPVVLAPQGHRLRPHLVDSRISVAFDDSRNAWAAVRAGAVLARAAALPLRIVTVFEPECTAPASMHVPPGYLRLAIDAERAVHAALERVRAEFPGAECVCLRGDAAEELVGESQGAACLVVGSRGYGPAPAVLLGTVGAALARTAECPLLVVPNGMSSPLSALCGELLTSGTARPGFAKAAGSPTVV